MGCDLGSHLPDGAEVTTILAWWFEPPTGVLAHGDARKPEVGVMHTVDEPLILCQAGLHGSVAPLDALQYATSSVIWRTEHSGDVLYGKDKLCSTERTYLRRLDATEVLRHFARLCALDVIHLWESPDVVKRYLETGDESLRDAAWFAARATARDAARDAAWFAARATGWATSSDAAFDAAWDSSSDVARASKASVWEKHNARLEQMLKDAHEREP